MALFGLAVASAWDLNGLQESTLVVYTTPALRDLLEKSILVRWHAEGGAPIEPVYVAAGEQYNRLRMSGARPEAHLFLHASPLFIEKGSTEGFFLAIDPPLVAELNASFKGADRSAGRSWVAFAWSPLIEVYKPGLGSAPDMARSDLRYGFPHPTLSNNGVYAVLFFEAVSREAGLHAVDLSVVQPVNARTNILGVADGSFDVTLGYEAVARFFQNQGARVHYDIPLVDGNRVTTPVVFSAGLVRGERSEEARDFVSFLLTNETQADLGTYFFRPVRAMNGSNPLLAPDLEGVRFVTFDWPQWAEFESAAPLYEVGRGRY